MLGGVPMLPTLNLFNSISNARLRVNMLILTRSFPVMLSWTLITPRQTQNSLTDIIQNHLSTDGCDSWNQTLAEPPLDIVLGRISHPTMLLLTISISTTHRKE